MELALKKIFGKKINVAAVSRTDSGVHALCNVAGFTVKSNIPVSRIPQALNSVLPKEIRVIKVEEKPKNYKIRYSAKSKEYEYLLCNKKILNPLYIDYVWHIRKRLNIQAMKKAAKLLMGRHDFSSFCHDKPAGKDCVRKIYRISVRKRKLVLWEGAGMEVISLKFKGNGFLHKMIRNLVGTLVEIGLGKSDPAAIKQILDAKDRKAAGRTAPPQGLCLVKINY